MRARLVALTLAVLMGATMTGCGEPKVSPEEGAEATEAARAEVEDALRSLADVASGVGLDLRPLSGRWSVCSAEPPSLEYTAGGSAKPDSTTAEAIAALTEALEADGWAVENAGTTPRPYAVLVRDDLRASLGESRRHPGEVDAGVGSPCVDTTNEQDDLLGETFEID
ncbi:hypothetical protein [Nocardioides abyssi]|uniref:Uncharacterized protein n=1 Tax=Nocardioides abyssi TaxID=3058370 RepID=A0ABT8ES79_9ACTN|nr:hypothetical protein [Nocardioides abyssi]MDN4160979.1 hypothetical protein [Nocardioides abyssi]